ncbi:hypothetical protein PR048_014355 [Dryococelus australis]|uniref:Uncharacterized protein n=1 Tax=Dryococelus australis TaxID=614101 RepID=A0ABQ9HE57_9NEOP|nr:hypothetical protein PR048_014355 [Dryococelus australis]
MERHLNARAGERDIPEKTHQPAISSGTIPKCKNPGSQTRFALVSRATERGAVEAKIPKVRPIVGTGMTSRYYLMSPGIHMRSGCLRIGARCESCPHTSRSPASLAMIMPVQREPGAGSHRMFTCSLWRQELLMALLLLPCVSEPAGECRRPLCSCDTLRRRRERRKRNTGREGWELIKAERTPEGGSSYSGSDVIGREYCLGRWRAESCGRTVTRERESDEPRERLHYTSRGDFVKPVVRLPAERMCVASCRPLLIRGLLSRSPRMGHSLPAAGILFVYGSKKSAPHSHGGRASCGLTVEVPRSRGSDRIYMGESLGLSFSACEVDILKNLARFKTELNQRNIRAMLNGTGCVCVYWSFGWGEQWKQGIFENRGLMDFDGANSFSRRNSSRPGLVMTLFSKRWSCEEFWFGCWLVIGLPCAIWLSRATGVRGISRCSAPVLHSFAKKMTIPKVTSQEHISVCIGNGYDGLYTEKHPNIASHQACIAGDQHLQVAPSVVLDHHGYKLRYGRAWRHKDVGCPFDQDTATAGVTDTRNPLLLLAEVAVQSGPKCSREARGLGTLMAEAAYYHHEGRPEIPVL